MSDSQNAADTFAEALRALHGDSHRDRARAATTVMSELNRLVRLSAVGTNDAAADDVVQEVLVKLLDKATVRRMTPGAERAYVTAMLRNRALDVVRAEQRRKTNRSEMVPVAEPVSDPVSRIHRSELERALSVVIDDAIATRRGAWRDGLRKDIDQVIALATGESTMTALIAQEPDPSSSAKTRSSRLHKRHQRARETLLTSAERLGKAGELTRDELAIVHQVLKLLLRCQPSTPSNVPRET